MSSTWSDKIPELRHRHAAVLLMSKHAHLRRTFERMHHDFMGVALLLKSHRTAAEVLCLLWSHRIEEFERKWKQRIELEVFKEIHGALRNIHHNSVARATGRKATLRTYDIERTPQDSEPRPVLMELYADADPEIVKSAMLSAFEFMMDMADTWALWEGEEFLAANAVLVSEGREARDDNELRDEIYANGLLDEGAYEAFFELDSEERRKVREGCKP